MSQIKLACEALASQTWKWNRNRTGSRLWNVPDLGRRAGQAGVLLPSQSAIRKYLEPTGQLPGELLAGPGQPSSQT